MTTDDKSVDLGKQGAALADRTPVLEVSGLSVDFAVDGFWVPAAKKLDYTVHKGEVLGIVGESGSGKSASSMALLGLLPRNSRTRGSARLSGEELVGRSTESLRKVRGKRIAAIFQEPMTALNPVYTIGFQLVETLRLHFGMSPKEAEARSLELLDLVEMPDPLKAYRSFPHQLSGGQRQRCMIAQSISCDPELLIADEPTTALDVTVQAEVLELLRSLQSRLGTATLLITHDMGVVADLADNMIVMRKGEIVERGTTHDVFASPRHPYTRELLEAVPKLGTGGASDETIDLTASLAASAQTDLDPELAAQAAEAERLAKLAHERAEREAEQREVVLELSDVVIEYPKRGRVPAFRAVEDANLVIRSGEVLGLVGESGSGKSTIGRAAIGLLPVHSGRLSVVGTDLLQLSRAERRQVYRRVGIVFQDPASSLNPRLPIGESIGEPLLLAGEARGKELQHRVQALLDSVELPREYANRYPHELSGGQKQRVGIARALALRPELLVADEPTSALDVSVQSKVLALLKNLQSEFGFACLFISHDLGVVDLMCDRIAVMHHGRIVEQGPREEVLRAPKEAYTQRLLAAIPFPDPDVQRERRELRLRILAETSEEV
ncbi:ABC transporter ATP-binding protein [Nocardioides zeae]|uniref:ABC transporter ATP-binding protein n=1 Tax=Nocardioides imazamoxiresistens TaxID=3231893 RepID=A0ABU3PXH0_9ACTN|nr:ABC transporter ATP-binding protein [Nocardioides zeae]MDT9593884.1 ABC transporter ATP-binding protein [Nocardioides zeae]